MPDITAELPANEALAAKNAEQPALEQPTAHLLPESAISAPGIAQHESELQGAAKFLRGPLKYDVDTSSPQLEAGRAFSVFVRVTNPYESAVTLLDVSASLPTEFRDKDNQDAGVWSTLKNQFKDEVKGRIIVAQNVDELNNPKATSLLTSPGEIQLQHGNSSLKRFTLRTWRSTLFMPAAYILQFQVQYKIDGILNLDTIRQEFNIRASLGAVLRGSVCGAIVGTVLHTLYLGSITLATWKPFLSQTLAGILLGGVLVVAFARKKDTQPFISIEDFYGGFFIGFSAGYLGQALLDTVLKGLPK